MCALQPAQSRTGWLAEFRVLPAGQQSSRSSHSRPPPPPPPHRPPPSRPPPPRAAHIPRREVYLVAAALSSSTRRQQRQPAAAAAAAAAAAGCSNTMPPLMIESERQSVRGHKLHTVTVLTEGGSPPVAVLCWHHGIGEHVGRYREGEAGRGCRRFRAASGRMSSQQLGMARRATQAVGASYV